LNLAGLGEAERQPTSRVAVSPFAETVDKEGSADHHAPHFKISAYNCSL
jgi:hypothetical protein